MASPIQDLFNAINGEELADAVAGAIRQRLLDNRDIKPHLTFPRFEYDFTLNLEAYPRETGMIHVKSHGGSEISWVPPSEQEVHAACAKSFSEQWAVTSTGEKAVWVKHFRRVLRVLYAADQPLQLKIRGNSGGEVTRPNLFREQAREGTLPVAMGDEEPIAPPQAERVAKVPAAYQSSGGVESLKAPSTSGTKADDEAAFQAAGNPAFSPEVLSGEPDPSAEPRELRSGMPAPGEPIPDEADPPGNLLLPVNPIPAPAAPLPGPPEPSTSDTVDPLAAPPSVTASLPLEPSDTTAAVGQGLEDRVHSEDQPEELEPK